MSPLLALFLVAALGYLLGRVRIGGVSLGVAAVLFAGLGLSAVFPEVAVPDIVPQLGLVIFIYAIGIGSGPGFFRSFRGRGLRESLLALGMCWVAALVAALLGRAIGASSQTTAGLFAGALTNTPALAAIVEQLHRTPGADPTEPIVAYSVTYPLGVLGLLGAMVLAQRIARQDVTRASQLGLEAGGQHLEARTIRVRAECAGQTPAQLRESLRLEIAFGRHKRGATLVVADESLPLMEGDLLSVIGDHRACSGAVGAWGVESDEHLELDRRVLDFRRITVSNADLVERPLRELRLMERLGATITRIRRADIELLASGDAELEIGDRVRVIAPRQRMDEVSRFFGDSARALAEIDVLTFGLGIVLGLLLGEIPVPLPHGTSFRLGIAGGPLVMALILGRLGRTGPLVWSLPFAASLTLRQVGILLFLGGVGLRSGSAFAQTLGAGEGVGVLVAGATLTFTTALFTLLFANHVLRMPIDLALGIVSGIHTQPAALAFASERTQSELPRIGYASVFPISTVMKIVVAQLIVGWL